MMREPVTICYRQGTFTIHAHLLMHFSNRIKADPQVLTQTICHGIETLWTCSFSLDPAMQAAVRAFLRQRQPQSLADFERDLVQASTPEEAYPTMQLVCLTHPVEPTSGFPLRQLGTSILQGKPRFVPVYVKNLRRYPAHVKSSFIRRGWGIFRDGNIISLGFNWHYRTPGLIYLPADKTPDRLAHTAAHEFGHIMGLGDAYGAWYRCYDTYPPATNYLMKSNQQLHEEEIRMMFQAQTTGKLSHFPIRYSWSTLKRGVKRSLQDIFAD